jgi:hypothetical protein
MDRMMTSGNLAPARPARLRAHWPALLLAVLAAETIGLVFPHLSPLRVLWLVTVAGLVAAAAVRLPAVAARIAPFA